MSVLVVFFLYFSHSKKQKHVSMKKKPIRTSNSFLTAVMLVRYLTRQYVVWWLPLSCSHSGDEAPLHSLRGPRTGETRSKPSREPGLASSTPLGQGENEGREGKGQEDESRGYGDEQDGIYVQGASRGDELELMLQVDWVSGSSSEVEALQFSSSKVSDITATNTHTHTCIRA